MQLESGGYVLIDGGTLGQGRLVAPVISDAGSVLTVSGPDETYPPTPRADHWDALAA